MGMVVCVAVEEEEWAPNRCAATISHDDFVDHDMSRTTGGGASYRSAVNLLVVPVRQRGLGCYVLLNFNLLLS